MQNNKKSEKNLKSERILRRIVDKALTKNTYILLDVFCVFFFVTSIQFVAYELRENLSNRSSGVQISHDICTRFGRYLYSTKCSWVIRTPMRTQIIPKFLTNITGSKVVICMYELQIGEELLEESRIINS